MYRIIRSLSGLGLLVKKNFLFYQDYSRSFCSLKLVKIGQKHKGSAPATMVGRDLRECLSSRTYKRSTLRLRVFLIPSVLAFSVYMYIFVYSFLMGSEI